MFSSVTKVSKRSAFFLYGTLLFPFAWTVNFLLGCAHQTTLRDLPVIETVSSLSIIFGFGFAVVALLRMERPIWLGLVSMGLYTYWIVYSVL
jgi:hypothetical protein